MIWWKESKMRKKRGEGVGGGGGGGGGMWINPSRVILEEPQEGRG